MLDVLAEVKVSQTGTLTPAGTLSGQMSIENAKDLIMMRAGIDPADFDDLPIQELLEVMNEVKQGLGSEIDEGDNEESFDEEDCILYED